MSTNAQLLYSGYEYGYLKLDLYGYQATEDEGYVVTTATLPGSRIPLDYLLTKEVLDEMGWWLDDELPRINRAEYIEAKAERVFYDRLMAMHDHQWRSL
jgi:hypothetical protein